MSIAERERFIQITEILKKMRCIGEKIATFVDETFIILMT